MRFAASVSLVYLATLLPRIFLHVMWRDEWQAWLLAVDGKPGLGELIRRMGYEGHPMLWHLLLWIAGQVWPDPLAMKLIHAAIATASVYLILACAPASRAVRILICLGYFFLFEYSVVSRNYGLGALFLIAFAALRGAKPGALVAQATCLAIACQANVYAVIISIALSLWSAQQWSVDGRRYAKRFVAAAVILALGIGLAVLQLIGSPDREFRVAEFDPSLHRWMQMTMGFWNCAIPLPTIRRDWWNSNILETWTNPYVPPYPLVCLGLMFMVASLWLFMSRRGIRTLWIHGTLGLLAFGTMFYPGFIRHQGHFYVLFLLAWWLGYERNAKVDWRSRGFVAIFSIQALAGVVVSTLDCLMPFSASREVARFIDERFPDAVLIGHVDNAGTPIAGVRGKAIYYPMTEQWGSYAIWKKGNHLFVPAEHYAEIARELVQGDPNREVIVILSAEVAVALDPNLFKPVAMFSNSTVASETYRLFRYDPAQLTSRPGK